MSCAFRAGVAKLRTGWGLCKITSQNNSSKIQVAYISSREIRKNRPPRPEPFPYTEKKFGIWAQFFDDTVFRFDDNTKIIIVDGPPAIGKGELAKKLAHELDMLYVPQVTPEDYYVHEHNFDLRTLDDKLPPSCRSADLDTFFKNPTLRNGACLQILFYQLRFKKYINILAHVLSTGQGVVTERSPWSDSCFASTMASNGFMSLNALKQYNIMIEQSLHELMRPHLIVYLDAPVKTVQNNIKQRNNPAEVDLRVLNAKFLTDLEKNYKYDYLKKMNEHCHILMYDYSCSGDFGVIVGDIETLNFHNENEEKKGGDWNLHIGWEWTNRRRLYAEDMDSLLLYLIVKQYLAEELIVSAEDSEQMYEVLKTFAPREVWDDNYSPEKPKGNKVAAVIS